jgi:hypothetical protein
LNGKVAAPVKKTELTAARIRCAAHATPPIRKSVGTSPTSGGRSVGIVRLRIKGYGVLLRGGPSWIPGHVGFVVDKVAME